MKHSILIEIDGGCSPGTVITARSAIRHNGQIQKLVNLPRIGANLQFFALCRSNADMDKTVREIKQLPHVVSVERKRIL